MHKGKKGVERNGLIHSSRFNLKALKYLSVFLSVVAFCQACKKGCDIFFLSIKKKRGIEYLTLLVLILLAIFDFEKRAMTKKTTLNSKSQEAAF